MQRLRLTLHFDSQPVAQGIHLHLSGSMLEGPGFVVDLSPVQASGAVCRVQTVALGQPRLQGACGGSVQRSHRAVVCHKCGVWCAAMGAHRGVLYASAHVSNLKLRVKIGQVKKAPGNSDCHPLTGIETERPHAGFAAGLYIRPQVQLGKCVQAGEGRYPPGVTPSILNGTAPTYAWPSNRSSSSPL